MSLLVRIHYHHGRCVELMEKMERISENPPHVLEWQIMVWLCKACREFLWNLLHVIWSSIPLWSMDNHPWLSITLWGMDDQPNLDDCNILWRDLVHVWGTSIGLLLLSNPMDMCLPWTTIMDELNLVWTLSVAPLSLCRPCYMAFTRGDFLLARRLSRWCVKVFKIWCLRYWHMAQS